MSQESWVIIGAGAFIMFGLAGYLKTIVQQLDRLNHTAERIRRGDHGQF